VSKKATDAEIKKAYRKMALKYHPDKNSAPSAEAAFKALNAAMETLSDSNKRQVYDEMGHDGASQHMSNGGGGGGGFGGRNPNDLSPEDLMNMFFGGGMRGGFGGPGFRTYHFGGNARRRAPQRQNEDDREEQQQGNGNQGGGFNQIFQLLPMILLLLSMTGFFSGGTSSGGAFSKPYSLTKEHPYNIARTTSSYGVTSDIPYYVTDTFRNSYGSSKGDLRRAELQVENDFRSDLYLRCDREKKHKARQIYEAKRVRNKDAQEQALASADKLQTKSCDDYFNKYRFSKY